MKWHDQNALFQYSIITIIHDVKLPKGVFKGGGGSTPPPRFCLKSEGKEVERKMKKNEKGWGGGGLIVNIFLGSETFLSGVQIFSRGVEKFSGGGLRNFQGGGLRNFRGGLRSFRGG